MNAEMTSLIGVVFIIFFMVFSLLYAVISFALRRHRKKLEKNIKEIVRDENDMLYYMLLHSDE